MKKYMTLDEIKAMTKDEFKKHLLSEGYKVTESPNDYHLLLTDVDDKTHSYVCSLYGASGHYSPDHRLGSIGNWGCYDSMYEFIPRDINRDVKKILEAIRKCNYEAESKKSGYLNTITVTHIPEKEFRKLMVDHRCYCAHFNLEKNRGDLIFN